MDMDAVDCLYRYWILKRRSLNNRPLHIPRFDDPEATNNTTSLSPSEDNQREKLKKLVALRQDLERVRNLCYMISRREKLKRSMVKMREQILEKQLRLVANEANAQNMSLAEVSAILEANHGPNVYDRLFAHADAETVANENDFELIISKISGEIAENRAQVRKDNPYRKGEAKVTSASNSASTAYKRIFSDTSDSEANDLMISPKNQRSKEGKSTLMTTAELAAKNAAALRQKPFKANQGQKGRPKKNQASTKKTTVLTRSSSSESLSSMSEVEDKKPKKKMTTAEAKAAAQRSIFSDSDSDSSKKPSGHSKRGNELPSFRTKAAMKEFSIGDLPSKSKVTSSSVTDSASTKLISKLVKSSSSSNSNSSSDSDSDSAEVAVNNKKAANNKKPLKAGSKSKTGESDFYPMIVPERAAARKATAKFTETVPAKGNKSKDQEKANSAEIQPNKKSSKDHRDHRDRDHHRDHRDRDRDAKESKKSKKHRRPPSSPSPSPERPEEKESDDVILPYVPQRKAALKATTQMKDVDRQISAREEALLFEEPSNKKGKKETELKNKATSKLLPLWKRLGSPMSDSDSLDEEPFPIRSPRGKSSRGRTPGGAHAPRSPRKSYKAKKPPEVKKELSSRVAALLSSRGAQLDDLFVDCGLKSKPEQPQPPTPVEKAIEVKEGSQPKEQKAVAPPKKKSSLSGSSSSSSGSSSGSGSSSSSSSSSEDESPAKAKPDRVESKPRGDVHRGKASVEVAKPTSKVDGLKAQEQQKIDERVHSSPAASPGGLSEPEPDHGLEEDHLGGHSEDEIDEKAAKNTSNDFDFAKPKILGKQPAPFEETKDNAIPPTPGAGLIAAGRIPGTGGRLQSEDEEEDPSGGGEHLSPPVSPMKSPLKAVPTPTPVVEKPTQPEPVVQPPEKVLTASEKEAVTMEESLALLEKLKQGSGHVSENSTTQSKDEGYVSAELAQAEQASELLAKLPPESPLLQAVEAMAKQQQFDLMQQQSTTTANQASNSTSQSSQSQYNQNRWHQQQQQQLQQQQQQQQQKEQEMLYNYFFKTGALPQTAAYAQNAYGLTPEQMKQLYGSTPEQMKQLYGAAAANNLDPFNHYYQQYNQFLQMQQQMQNYTSQGSSRSRTQQAQAAAQATASMQNMQAQLEQLAAYNPQLAAMAKWQQEQQHQQQQQQQQQKQLKQQQVHHHQQQQLQQHQLNQKQGSYGSQNPDLSKVQTPVTSTQVSSRRQPQPSRDSPLRPSQSPRGGGQHFQQDHNIPSATNLKHLPGYPKAAPEASTKAKEAEMAISQDLLDSVAGLSKLLPPTSEKGSGTPSSTTAMASTTPGRNSSPSKTPATPVNVTDVTPEHHPSSIRRTSSVASDKDKTFEDLVKKVESSPKVISDHKSTPKAGTDKDEASGMSDMNDDYDDMKGGVDYDDFDFDQDEYLPRGGRSRRGQQMRGRGRGRGAAGAKGNLAKVRPFKSRGRPKAKNVTIDTKNLAKVHRTVAGTDYDFEDEFDDEFGVEKPKAEVSLKDLREQSKKTGNVPIYMKTEGGKGKGDDFEFDEMLKNDITKKPVNKKVNNSRVLANRGRPSGRPKRDTRTSNSVEADDFDIEENDEIDSVMDQPEPPKLPKLKLGAMMASKKEKKKSRRESNDSTAEQTSKVPKLKIKLGPKPDKPKSEPNDIIKDEKEPDQKPTEVDPNVKPSPMSSPTKRGSKIDLLAERLLNKNQGSATNDLESIFGPSGVPLDMSGSSDKDTKKSDPIEMKSGTNEKSELEMIQEELASNTGTSGTKSGTTPNFIQSSPAGASPHAHTVYGPLKKAFDAGKASALEKEKEKTSEDVFYPKKHLKLKFKNLDVQPDLDRQTSTPPPPAPPSNNPSISQQAPSASSVTSSAPSNVSYHPRMNRKKQLLNQYYGHDVYPAPPSNNGPASTSSSTVINSYDSLTTYAGSSDQPPQPPRPVIKMPKAVASVTSVPTRADYQQQLEANLERKRKREGGNANDLGLLPESGKGKRKRGRGAKTVEEDSEYRPKTKESQNQSGTANKNDSAAEKMRKTRGKPPKKCLAETEEHEPGDLKAESMKYAEAIRAQFDEPKGANNKGRKKKRKAASSASTASEAAGENASKTPRLVIKFSKESVNNLKENGGDEYDFVEDAAPTPNSTAGVAPALAANAPNDMKFVDGTVDSALSSVNNSPNSATEVSKVTKLKIKIWFLFTTKNLFRFFVPEFFPHTFFLPLEK